MTTPGVKNEREKERSKLWILEAAGESKYLEPVAIINFVVFVASASEMDNDDGIEW